MINNRQGGRRRGRGGQRPPGLTGRPDGNRQDNRQRGNAAQLLEKYKALARDSQLAGDRVQTEYYLQFAEHYFRVLGESRARFDEQRRARGEDVDEGYDEDGEGLEGDFDEGDGEQQQDRPQRQEQQPRRQYEERAERQPRGERFERNDRPQRDDRPQREDRQQRAERGERPERPERAERFEQDDQQGERVEVIDRARAPRSERPARALRTRARTPEDGEASEPQRIAFDVIPPAIGPVESIDADVEQAPAPRRRTRRLRPENDEGIAPAA